MSLCLSEGGVRPSSAWQCPVDGCAYTTDVRRARATHLLRQHNLLFRRGGQSPVPLEGEELAARREALRRRNRGSRQRAREAGRVYRADGHRQEPQLPDGQFQLDDEDWGSAVVDINLLLQEDLDELSGDPGEGGPPEAWLVVPWVPPPPPEVAVLPNGIPVTEFTERVSQWRIDGMSIPGTIRAATAYWRVAPSGVPFLALGVQLVATSRQTLAFDRLDSVQRGLLEGHSVDTLFRALVEAMILTASHR